MIAFPRAMPDVGELQHGFEPQRVDYLSPETGARLGAVSAGWPLWRLTIGLGNMLEEKADLWRAWVQLQRGAGRLFYGRDLGKTVPRFHKGGIPFTGRPAGWSQAIDANGDAVLTLSGCLPDMVLMPSDLVGFEWDGWKRTVVRVMEPAVAGTDGTLTVTIEPPVHGVTPAVAAVNLVKPTCLMRLVPGSTQLGQQMGGGYWTAAGGQIEAIQELIP